MAGALGSACGGHSAVTPARVPRSRPAASVPGYPLLACQADSVRKRAMFPIVLPRNERTAVERGVVSRVRSSGLPRTLGPSQNTPARREWQEVGTSGPAPRGPSLGGPRAPPRTARLVRGSRRRAGGGGGQPEGGGQVQAEPTTGVGSFCRCKGAATGPGPPPTRPWVAGSVPSPSPGTPPIVQPQAPGRGRRRGSAGPHVRALPGGGVPGRARAAARGGRGVPRTPSLLLLPPRPPLPLPSSCAVPSSAWAGGSVRRAEPGQAL